MNNHDNEIKRSESSWRELIGEVMSIILEHIEFEFDGANKTASLNYNGPRGWRLSVKTDKRKDV